MAEGAGTVTGAQTLILFLVLTLCTIWFTNLTMKALDILYRPRIRSWVSFDEKIPVVKSF